MKTVRTLAFVILTGIATTASSQTYSLAVEKFKTTDNFIVNITNPLASKLTLTVKDNTGKAYLQESYMFVEKIKKVLFLGSLQPGDYMVEISNGVETKLANVRVEGIDKTVHPENGKGLVVGFSKLKPDNSIDVIVQNKLEKNVSIKIYKNNSLLSSEDLGNSGELIKKILRLDKLDKRELIVKVGTKENVYLYRVTP